MSLIAEFRLSSSHLPLIDTTAAAPQTILEIDTMLIVDPDHPVAVCWVETTSFGAFERALAEDAVTAYSVLEDTPEQRLYHIRLEKSKLFSLKGVFDELGAAPDGGTTITDGGWEIRARFPDRNALARFRDDCREYGVSFRLETLHESLSNDRDFSGLTPKQREALILAYESGYYHIPRQASLGDLSEQLDISKPAFSKRLRRAQQHVLGNVVESGGI